MKRSVWGIVASAMVGTAVFGSPVTLKGASCRAIGAQPFAGVGAPVAGIGAIAEGVGGQYLIPYLSFDKAQGPAAGTYHAVLWDGQNGWKAMKVGTFKATNGVLQFVNLRGRWYGFSNSAQSAGGPQVPVMSVSNARGGFDAPQAIDVFSNWGEFDSSAKSLGEDRIGITGRDRMGGGFTTVFAEKVGDKPWFSEPILLQGKPTPEGFATMIGYDRGNSPWIAFESQPSGPLNEVSVLTRTVAGWEQIPVAGKGVSNLVGAYLPSSNAGEGERLALAWVRSQGQGGTQYEVRTAVLDLATRTLSGERTVASGIEGRMAAPLPAITVAHDGLRATLSLMSAETHRGWTGQFVAGVFESLREIGSVAGQSVIGYPQAFYSACDDSAALLVGFGSQGMDLGARMRIMELDLRPKR